MDIDHDAELAVVLAEGILSKREAAALALEAQRVGQRPLDLLLERGQISGETFASLQVAARGAADQGSETPIVAHAPVAHRRSPEPQTAQNASRASGEASAQAVAGSQVSVPGSKTPGEISTVEEYLPPRRRPGAASFPVTNWERYECLRFLGQGGMGKVFLARDQRLRREVAIKFVRGDKPTYVQRLVSEARAQARVNHDRVCKVYEVGEVQGEVYIAMQYIDGKPLIALISVLNVEQKAIIVRDAARGLHEAHRAGLIHRDVKPNNIMVECTEDGDLKPYVLDFGLARDLKNDETEPGVVLGTPHYMSPEQARGEVERLDRRADVYSLGATLYHLLAGEPPVPGDSNQEVLRQIATSKPRSLREWDRDIPADLDAIVLKCLEKDRSARYDSARALAEDLDRFLGGDPVQARRAGVWYRLRKKLLKHRRTAALAATALTLALFALGWGLTARHEVAVRERLARRFTELVEHIEARARYSALAPLHDIRADRKGLRAEMAELEDEIRQVGAIAVGPGHYALGRGFLALGDEAKAREYFESSWEHGFQQPRVAYALALVMGHLYQAGLLDAERIDSPERRVARKREIERRYRDPALAYLRQSTGADVPSTEYVAALIAFYEDRLEEALVHLDAISELPWRYEVPALRGDIFLARASRRSNQGDRQGALADFAAGRRAYLSAAAIGESVPEVHAALGELEYAVMLMELHGQGDVTPPFERGLQALSRARLAEPDHYGPLVLEARLHRHFAEYRMHQGSNVENLLGKAIALAERALATAPLQPSARLELGRCYRQLGQYRQEHNQDPGEQLGKSIATFKAIAVKDKDYEVYFDLGLVFSVWANYETLVGLDPLPHRDLAIESYRTSTRLDERVPDAWIQLGIAYFERASHPRSKNPDDDLQEADSAMAKALSLNPQHIVTYFYQGEVHVLMAQRQRRRDADPEPNLATALAMYRKGLTINPKLPQLHNGVGTVLIEQAKGCGPEKGSRITSKEIHLYALCNGDDGMVSLGCHHGTAAVSDQSTSASR